MQENVSNGGRSCSTDWLYLFALKMSYEGETKTNGFDVMNQMLLPRIATKQRGRSRKPWTKSKPAFQRPSWYSVLYLIFKVYLRWSLIFLYYAYLIILFLQEDAFVEGTSGVCLLWSCPNTETNSLYFESDAVAKENNKATSKIKKVLNKTKTGVPKAKSVFISLSCIQGFCDLSFIFYILYAYLSILFLQEDASIEGISGVCLL